MPRGGHPDPGTVALLATMHGKDRVIAPVPGQGLGHRVALAEGQDTDRAVSRAGALS
jgi:hypothetical protein